MTMSNLIPTPRTDKNGVTVIRHMKPQTAPKSRTTIPPVSTPVDKTRAIIIDEATRSLTGLLETGGSTGVNEKIARKITDVLTSYTDTTLDRIQHYPWTPTTSSHFSVGIMNTWDETTANDYMAINTVLAEEEPNGVSPFHYNSWQYCPELHPTNNEGDYPEERLNQLLTHYRVIEYMDSQDDEPYHWNELTSDYDSYRIEDAQFRQLLLNPGPDYNRDDIIRIITTHHTYDPERIKRMLDLGVGSMTSGVL